MVGEKNINKIGISPTNMVAFMVYFMGWIGMEIWNSWTFLAHCGWRLCIAWLHQHSVSLALRTSRACSVDTFCLDLLEKPPKLINTHIPHRFAESMFMTDQEKESLRKHSETNLGLYIIWCSNPLKKYESHLGLLFPILMESHKIP